MDFHIQYVVWIICGIKNIMKINYKSICSYFYIVFWNTNSSYHK
jgi:hypothetical protein